LRPHQLQRSGPNWTHLSSIPEGCVMVWRKPDVLVTWPFAAPKDGPAARRDIVGPGTTMSRRTSEAS
jgi:hypothetical protein